MLRNLQFHRRHKEILNATISYLNISSVTLEWCQRGQQWTHWHELLVRAPGAKPLGVFCQMVKTRIDEPALGLMMKAAASPANSACFVSRLLGAAGICRCSSPIYER